MIGLSLVKGAKNLQKEQNIRCEAGQKAPSSSSFLKKKLHRISEAEQREPKHSRSRSEPTAVNLREGR